jgi:hypothetical protein
LSYPKRLLRLQPTRGFIADTADQEVGPEFWTVCQNMQFRDGFATRVEGYRPAYVPEVELIAPTALFHAVNSRLLDLNWWLLFQQSGVAHAIQANTVQQIDGGLLSPVTEPQQYSSALINGLPIISNGLDEPVYWDAQANLQTLPDWPATEAAGFIAVLKFHVFALNISAVAGRFESQVKWSSATEPGTVPQSWTPAADNDAGSVVLADSPGPILCAYPLGDTLFIYKRSAIYQARYVGGNTVFSFRKVESTSGALSPRSVADVGGAHLVVTDGDIVLNDGTTRRSIGESRVKDFMFNQLDPEQFGQVQAIYNRSKEEVVIGFPSAGSLYIDSAIVYDLSRDAWGVRSLDPTTDMAVGLISDTVPSNTWENRTEVWADAQGTWASGLNSGAIDSLVTLEPEQMVMQDAGTGLALDAVIGRTGLTFGEPERIKFVRRVHVRTRDGFNVLYVRVGASMTPTGTITWADEVPLQDGQQIANCFAVGRYIAVEVRSDDQNVWKCTGVELEAELRGYY